jgi:hypothetical protein
VRRETFAGPGPWSILTFSGTDYVQTPDDDPAFLYQDVLIARHQDRTAQRAEVGRVGQCCADDDSDRAGLRG